MPKSERRLKFEILLIWSCTRTLLNSSLVININSIPIFYSTFQLFTLNFNFLRRLGLVHKFSANQHSENFACAYINYKWNSYWTRILYTLGKIRVPVANISSHLILRLQWTAQTNHQIVNFYIIFLLLLSTRWAWTLMFF